MEIQVLERQLVGMPDPLDLTTVGRFSIFTKYKQNEIVFEYKCCNDSLSLFKYGLELAYFKYK